MSDITLILFRLETAEKTIAAQAEKISELADEIKEIERTEAEKEKKALLVGVMSLGSIVMTLAGVIWAYRSVIFK